MTTQELLCACLQDIRGDHHSSYTWTENYADRDQYEVGAVEINGQMLRQCMVCDKIHDGNRATATGCGGDHYAFDGLIDLADMHTYRQPA